MGIFENSLEFPENWEFSSQGKIDDHKKKYTALKKITLKWFRRDKFIIFRMIEARKTHLGHSYSPASYLDFGFYNQTG